MLMSHDGDHRGMTHLHHLTAGPEDRDLIRVSAELQGIGTRQSRKARARRRFLARLLTAH